MSTSDSPVPAVPAPDPTGGSAPAAPRSADAVRGAVRIVKRYNNRKLYDTVESRYVTLPQIAELVRQGEDVRIIDNTTKEDLTSMTLAQILYEEERKQSRALPLTALKDLLHASGERFISTLREGPVGKLIGRSEVTVDAEPPADVSSVPLVETPPVPVPVPGTMPGEAAVSGTASGTPNRVQQLVEQSREALDLWQHRMDDRMKAFWETINPALQIQGLQAEIRRLQSRIDRLEGQLVAREGIPERPRTTDDPEPSETVDPTKRE